MEFLGDCFLANLVFNIAIEEAGRKGTRLTKFGRHLLILRRPKPLNTELDDLENTATETGRNLIL